MQLPFLKKSEKSHVSERHYLLAVEISPSTVKSSIWSVINGKTQVLAVGSSVSWDDQSVDSLVMAVDHTLTDATTRLDPSGKIQPEQLIFGLPTTWVNSDKIYPDKLQLLKIVSEKLALKPVGFVVTCEAIVKFLSHTEGVPPTTILLGFWPHFLEVSLVKLGKIVGSHLIKKSDHITDDVVEGLSRFSGVDMLPSRMLLYDSGIDLEETKQLLLQHPWQAPQTRLPFLHFPKVEILPSDFTVRSIALSGGTEVAQAIGLISSSDELGFMADTDIAQVSPPPPPPPPPDITPPSLPRPKLTLPKIQLPLIVIIIATSIAVAMTGLFAAYWFLPKASVTVWVTPKKIEHQFELLANTKSNSTSTTIPTVPAQSQEVTVSGEKTLPTTGSKVIGDKATGTVTIYNATDSTRKFPAGTILSSPSGLRFTLDEEVSVASGSGSAVNPLPGKTTAKTTASKIGSDYNLSAGTEFRVGTFAVLDVVAKNEAAFSGGTSHEVQAVSKTDISQLRSELSSSLKDQASQQLLQKVSPDQTIITESIDLQVISENFDHKMDDPADNLTLKTSVKATAIILSKIDLDSVVDNQIRPQIPAGFTPDSEISRTFTVKKTDKSSVTFTVQVTANLLPTLDRQQIIKDITGKYPLQAKDYLESLPAVAQIDILISPHLPERLTTLPRVSQNITLSVQPFK